MGHDIPKHVLYKLISDFDFDMNGTVDFDEFYKMMLDRPCETDTLL